MGVCSAEQHVRQIGAGRAHWFAVCHASVRTHDTHSRLHALPNCFLEGLSEAYSGPTQVAVGHWRSCPWLIHQMRAFPEIDPFGSSQGTLPGVEGSKRSDSSTNVFPVMASMAAAEAALTPPSGSHSKAARLGTEHCDDVPVIPRAKAEYRRTSARGLFKFSVSPGTAPRAAGPIAISASPASAESRRLYANAFASAGAASAAAGPLVASSAAAASKPPCESVGSCRRSISSCVVALDRSGELRARTLHAAKPT